MEKSFEKFPKSLQKVKEDTGFNMILRHCGIGKSNFESIILLDNVSLIDKWSFWHKEILKEVKFPILVLRSRKLGKCKLLQLQIHMKCSICAKYVYEQCMHLLIEGPSMQSLQEFFCIPFFRFLLTRKTLLMPFHTFLVGFRFTRTSCGAVLPIRRMGTAWKT